MNKNDFAELAVRLGRIYPIASPLHIVDAVRQLSRAAATVNRLAVLECNEPCDPDVLKNGRERAYRVARRALDVLETSNPKQKVAVHIGGDPRGYCLKLHNAELGYNTWGGAEEGWGVA